MITEMIDRANALQNETGNHISWCTAHVAGQMNDDEITQFANEIGSRRFISTAERAITGINRLGEKVSERNQHLHRMDILTMIACQMDAEIRIRKAQK